MKRIVFFFALAAFFYSFKEEQSIELNPETNIVDLLEVLGKDFSEKRPDFKIEGVSARVGEDIVRNGFSKRDGLKKSKRQSKHFVCTSCHNTQREDPLLNRMDAQARLDYAVEYELPFLQATTLFGAVNRQTYYNGDYEKKYGDLVYPARKNIREAIQLCAKECAQGRVLKDWELESILAYLWELQLKIGDLEINERELESIEMAIDNEVIRSQAVVLLNTKYSLASKATWIEPPSDRKEGTGLEGNAQNGKLIYEKSCLHCHYQKKYSFLHLDNSQMSFNHLDSKAGTYSRHSVYQVVRYGTFSKHGKKSYMPFFTEERMSEQQLADLRAYIQERASS